MTTLPAKGKFDEYVKLGLLRSQRQGDLTIYQYTELVQYDRLWNNVTLSARGIVFDDEGTLVQRCIPKFFNSDEIEGVIASKTNSISKPVVQDKVDGSLIKVSNDEKHGLVATSKSSFQSTQAMWARELIETSKYDFCEGRTYHFELIHPNNRIVLNYGDRKELVLFAVVDNETGKEYDIYKDEFSQFNRVDLLSDEVLDDINKLNERGLREGVVANFGAYRLKFKTEDYVRIHRIVTNYTPLRVWESLSTGQPIERMNVPEEFLIWLEQIERDLLDKFTNLRDEVYIAAEKTENMTNKELGLSKHPYASYLFSIRTRGSCDDIIWKRIKPKGTDEL